MSARRTHTPGVGPAIRPAPSAAPAAAPAAAPTAKPEASPRTRPRNIAGHRRRALAASFLDLDPDSDDDNGDEPEEEDDFGDLWDGNPDDDAARDPDDIGDLDDPDDDAPAIAARRPAIVFTFATTPRAPALRTARIVRAGWPAGPRARVAAAPLGRLRALLGDDASEIVDRRRRLADALLATQPDALMAPSRLAAFDALVPLTQQQLADAAFADIAGLKEQSRASELSRERNLLVGCPWGIAPLHFFCWKGHRIHEGDRIRLLNELRPLVVEVRADPTRTYSAIGRATAQRVLEHSSPDERQLFLLADKLRHWVPPVRNLLESSELVEAVASRFPDITPVQARQVLGLTGERGEALAVLVLAGAFTS